MRRAGGRASWTLTAPVGTRSAGIGVRRSFGKQATDYEVAGADRAKATCSRHCSAGLRSCSRLEHVDVRRPSTRSASGSACAVRPCARTRMDGCPARGSPSTARPATRRGPDRRAVLAPDAAAGSAHAPTSRRPMPAAWSARHVAGDKSSGRAALACDYRHLQPCPGKRARRSLAVTCRTGRAHASSAQATDAAGQSWTAPSGADAGPDGSRRRPPGCSVGRPATGCTSTAGRTRTRRGAAPIARRAPSDGASEVVVRARGDPAARGGVGRRARLARGRGRERRSGDGGAHSTGTPRRGRAGRRSCRPTTVAEDQGQRAKRQGTRRSSVRGTIARARRGGHRHRHAREAQRRASPRTSQGPVRSGRAQLSAPAQGHRSP